MNYRVRSFMIGWNKSCNNVNPMSNHCANYKF